MMTKNMAKALVEGMRQRAAVAEGTGGEVVSHLTSVLERIDTGELAPTRAVEEARKFAVHGEDELQHSPAKVTVTVKPVHH